MEKKKRRSHEEVVAAREAYAKERHDKKVAREAKKVERKERKKLREARKNMTNLERRNLRLESKIQKVKKKNAVIDNSIFKLNPYAGTLKPGDRVKAYFAGCPITGELIQIEYAEDEESKVSYDIYTVLVQDSSNPYYKMECPLRREKIIEKI